jgi:uncharacterized membrane protein YhaH (DUF805 family)
LDFTGRSRRTEVIYYWIATMLIGAVLGFTLGTILPFGPARLVVSIVQLLLTLPIFALTVRRLHDQDRVGWGVLLPVAAIALNIANLVLHPLDPFRARLLPWQLTLAGAAALLLWLILLLLPGTKGANRFGGDPREG